MKLLFKVDQKEALRQGINAPQSTVLLHVNPADLSETEREVLAEALVDGYDCTRGTDPLSLVKPDFDGLRDAIVVMLAERDSLD